MKQKLFGRNLEDTAFSVDRLVIWAVGITLVTSVFGIVGLAFMDKEIPRPLQSVATFSLGSFVTMITGTKIKAD